MSCRRSDWGFLTKHKLCFSDPDSENFLSLSPIPLLLLLVSDTLSFLRNGWSEFGIGQRTLLNGCERERERVERGAVILWSPICNSFRGVALGWVCLGLSARRSPICCVYTYLACTHILRGPTSGNGFCFTDENQGRLGGEWDDNHDIY